MRSIEVNPRLRKSVKFARDSSTANSTCGRRTISSSRFSAIGGKLLASLRYGSLAGRLVDVDLPWVVIALAFRADDAHMRRHGAAPTVAEVGGRHVRRLAVM